MALQKTLFRWSEPWAFAKERAARSRAKWPVWKRIAFGFALGTGIILTALLKAMSPEAAEQLKERTTLDWIGIWFIACVGMTALLWVVSFIPQPRMVVLRDRSIYFYKRTIRWDCVTGYSWRDAEAFGVLTLSLSDGRQAELGTKLNDHGKIQSALNRVGLREVHPEMSKNVRDSSPRLLQI
jgi:hypothetical protein